MPALSRKAGRQASRQDEGDLLDDLGIVEKVPVGPTDRMNNFAPAVAAASCYY